MKNPKNSKSKSWQWAFLCFVVAGLTGFLYRVGFVTGLPDGCNLINIRHAHSHLMFFGWASFFPLYFIYLELISKNCSTLCKKILKVALTTIMVLGLVSFVSFLLWGYKPVSIGSANIPLSAILSGFVMIGWYVFIGGYLIHRKITVNTKRNIWYESALLMLFISSLGAWGVGLSTMFHFGTPLLSKALTHFFLSTFTEGWIVLILVGFLDKKLELLKADYFIPPTILVGLIALGAPLTFPYGISVSFLDTTLLFVASIGGLMVGTSILLFVYSVIRNHKALKVFWIWSVAFLGIKALMQVIASFAPSELWLSDQGIRILYLHVLLLGSFTTTMILYTCREHIFFKKYIYAVFYSILIVLLSLILLTNVWPLHLKGTWIFPVLAGCALLPVCSVSALWYKLRTINNSD